MVDIYGRSRITREKKSEVEMKDIIKKIKDEISGLINIKDVDEKEIVIFENNHGKLKTSNVSLDDILIKDPTADDNSVAVFQKGKLAPSVIISSITNKLLEFEQFLSDFLGGPRQPVIQVAYIKAAIDNLARLRNEYDVHINQFASLRRNFVVVDNVIEKFFEKKNPTADNVKILQSEIINFQQKTVNDLDNLTQTVNNNLLQVTNKITEIEDYMKKIVHSADRIQQIVHVVYSGTFSYVDVNPIGDPRGASENTLNFERKIYDAYKRGIYRFTMISSKQFNIEIYRGKEILGKGTDTVTFFTENFMTSFKYVPADGKPDIVNCTIVIEYLGIPRTD